MYKIINHLVVDLYNRPDAATKNEKAEKGQIKAWEDAGIHVLFISSNNELIIYFIVVKKEQLRYLRCL